MKSNAFVSLIALAGACVAATGSMAAGADPLVIPGIGPESQHAPQPQRAQRHAATPVYAPGPSSGRGNYGGGFIEMLMTGNSSAPSPRAVIYNRPPDAMPPATYQPRMQQAAPLAPAMQAQPVRRGATYASLPAADMSMNRAIDPQFMKQDVAYNGPHGVGTIVVDTPNRFLYLVTSPGRAIRYGIGVGRPGFEWAGVKSVTRKAEWPDWRPPSEMLKRRPDLPAFMAGGPDNPLGARALYLGSSLYRIHGTNEPHTIGTNVSSGCIRMMNDDVVDLYGRVKVGAKVIVR
jgi:lipoprotein-anchoring transpeptidase ErfK/SrfK